MQDIINDFSPEKFIHFFRLKNRSFKPHAEPAPEYDDDQFTDAFFPGEIPFNETDKLVVYSFRVNSDLTERSGKKAQYEKGKKILKATQADAGIFIFYDSNNNFRFSLITVNYTGTKRRFSHFKRYTYFVSPDETNRTFLNQIGRADFSSIEKIKEAFSVEKVTKEFYQEIANWYFWSLKHAGFPSQAEEEPNGRNIAVIRLITRIIFIWFMKQKNIVPGYLFDSEKALPEILKDLSDNESTYYKAILQNLFFATLNTEQKDRRFRDEKRFRKGWNQDFGNQYVYRYHDLFRSPGKIQEYFGEIPFLNGGLFECLDDGRKDIYIDGFTERSKKYQPVVPDFLFFSDATTVDLSKDYGEAKYRKARVRGLINILKSYNFTIDENTPVDEEVALDPELLGKVFENLLASYNPETATTARKATGSYYTPREVVDYMVDESLKEYFVATVPGIDRKRLDALFSYESDESPFSDKETDKLITAIHQLRVIDPAVGSGAFPMGILHKLVHILHKLDPHNLRWKEEQTRAVEQNVKDPALRQELKQKIEESFALNELDYGRKLYLIQNCIYGVDIQPIAIQIAKLRFFISLLVDVKVDKTRDNYGIEPLPNLETKFVVTNTLIGLERPEQVLLQTREVLQLEAELKELREQYFSVRDVQEKERIKNKDAEIRRQLSQALKNSGLPAGATEKIARWDPYNTNVSADWFDPEWMFGVRDGFDVVIANPPYVRQEKIKHVKPALKKEYGDFFCGTADIYTYFYKRGIDLLKEKGCLCFIAPNKFMRAGYGKNTRNLLMTEVSPKVIIDFCDLPIFDATTYPAVILVEKNACCAGTVNDPDAGARRAMPLRDEFLAATFTDAAQLDNLENTLSEIGFPMPVGALKPEGWNLEPPEVLALMEKLRKAGTPLGEYVKGRFYRGILTGLNEAFVIDKQTRERLIAEDPKSEELIKPWLRGRDIKKWKAEWDGLYLINIPSSANKQWPWTDIKAGTKAREIFKQTYPAVHDHLTQWKDKLKKRDDQGKFWWELRSCAYYKEFEEPNITWGNLAMEPKFAFDASSHYISAPANIIPTNDLYLLAILNSPLCKWWISSQAAVRSGGFLEYKPMYVEKVPVFPATNLQKTPIIDRVQKILANPDSPDVPRLEKEIDELIYEIYNLTPEEIAIVEGRR